MKAFYESIEYSNAGDWNKLHKFLDDINLLRQLRIHTIRIRKDEKWIKYVDICDEDKDQAIFIKALKRAANKENMWEKLKQ